MSIEKNNVERYEEGNEHGTHHRRHRSRAPKRPSCQGYRPSSNRRATKRKRAKVKDQRCCRIRAEGVAVESESSTNLGRLVGFTGGRHS